MSPDPLDPPITVVAWSGSHDLTLPLCNFVSFDQIALTEANCSDLQSKIGKPAIMLGFQPTLSATDGPRNRHYLQLNLQSAGSDLQSSPPNRHYLQLKRCPRTHQTVPKLDVVLWTMFLDGGKPRQTLSGLRGGGRPANDHFLHRAMARFLVAHNVGSNPMIAGSASSIAGSVANNSGLNAFQLQIILVGKWR